MKLVIAVKPTSLREVESTGSNQRKRTTVSSEDFGISWLTELKPIFCVSTSKMIFPDYTLHLSKSALGCTLFLVQHSGLSVLDVLQTLQIPAPGSSPKLCVLTGRITGLPCSGFWFGLASRKSSSEGSLGGLSQPAAPKQPSYVILLLLSLPA